MLTIPIGNNPGSTTLSPPNFSTISGPYICAILKIEVQGQQMSAKKEEGLIMKCKKLK
jgi:hypothetical protein